MASRPSMAAQLFVAALALKSVDRDAFLDKACSHDPDLKNQVLHLLAEDARAGSFLEAPPFKFCDEAETVGKSEAEETIAVSRGDLSPSWGRLKPGQVLIERFVIVRFIAKGGMGEVYEAQDRFLQGVHVALKTILPHISDEPAIRQRFEREVLLAREVSHPNLCPIYEIFHCEQPSPGFLFLTMKLLPGEALAERMRSQNAISVKEGLAIFRQMSAGLIALHDQGIVHRDIKPNNIMLDGTGEKVRLWITDFGLARTYESDTTGQSKLGVAGTPGYIAPELYAGHQASQASDLYAFGVVLHEVFTGEKPAIVSDRSSIVASPRLNTSGAPAYCVHLIRGCLDLDPGKRCQAFEAALHTLGVKRRQRVLWSRRHFITSAAAGICALAAGSWMEREAIYDFLHPLPGKRFVALLNWPKAPDNSVSSMLTGALAAIKNEFARIEAFDRNLFVVSPEDVDQDLTQAANFRAICDPLGANLVLAASGISGAKHFDLLLRVFDPVSGRALRAKSLECDLNDITSLPAKAVRAAASLLGVGRYLKDKGQTQPGTQSTAAFTAFQMAESLKKEQNDKGLDAAIDKYKEAVELDPHYALAFARLGIAYGRLYAIRRDPGALELARGNCERALALDPNLVDGHLSMALLLEQTGNEQGALDEIAKSLKLDPSNPSALVWQGQIYSRLNRWADAEQSFRRVMQERPNYWLAYHELANALNGQGKYQDAIEEFRAATLAAPGNAQAFANLGGAYLQIGNFVEATEALEKSMALAPNDLAAVNASLALRCQGKPMQALSFARKAVELNPSDDTNWLELGECYSSLRNRESDAKAAYLRAAQEAERHLRTDPTDGASVMLLALYQVKSGTSENALSLIKKAESLGADDMDSQLFKARILELLGMRNEALTTLAVCFRKGATAFQFAAFPDMESLRQDPRYKRMIQSNSPKVQMN